MKSIDLIVLGIVFIIVLLALFYIYSQKKKGVKCIGCSSAGTCSKNTCSSFNEETIVKIRKDIRESKLENNKNDM